MSLFFPSLPRDRQCSLVTRHWAPGLATLLLVGASRRYSVPTLGCSAGGPTFKVPLARVKLVVESVATLARWLRTALNTRTRVHVTLLPPPHTHIHSDGRRGGPRPSFGGRLDTTRSAVQVSLACGIRRVRAVCSLATVSAIREPLHLQVFSPPAPGITVPKIFRAFHSRRPLTRSTALAHAKNGPLIPLHCSFFFPSQSVALPFLFHFKRPLSTPTAN